MMGHPVNRDADSIIKAIPKDTIGCEIGVWEANTSMKFWKLGLQHLYLVDSWSPIAYKNQPKNEHGSYEDYLKKYKKLTGEATEGAFHKYYDKIYRKVVNKFKEANNVTIYRMTSKEFFESFTGQALDWVYVDGAHDYIGCLYDLEESRKIVKPGGKIFGDDYRWTNKNGKPGVTQAVDEFINKYGYNIKRYGLLQFEIGI